MKLFKKLRLGYGGFSHVEMVIALAVIAGVAAIGVKVLTASHADSIQPMLYSYDNYHTNNSGIVSDDQSGTSTTIASSAANYSAPYYSPNSKYFVYEVNAILYNTAVTEIKIYNTTTDTTTTVVAPVGVTAGDFGATTMAWFPNSTEIALALSNANTKTSSGVANDTLIYTLNVQNSQLTEVKDVSGYGFLNNLTVTGDGKYVVFTTDGVYALNVGSKAVTTLWDTHDALIGSLRADFTTCYAATAQPNTTDKVAWVCEYNNTVQNGNEIDIATVGGTASNSRIYSSVVKLNSPNTIYNVESMAWSHDGTKLALTADKQVNTGSNCVGTQRPVVATLSNSKVSNFTIIQSGSLFNYAACKGGGDPNANNDQIAWSPDGSKIAFVDRGGNPGGNVWPGLYTISSNGSSSATLVSNYGSGVSW